MADIAKQKARTDIYEGNRLYRILRKEPKDNGDGYNMYVHDDNGIILFPHRDYRDLKPGPVAIKHVIYKNGYGFFRGRQYKLTTPSEKELFDYIEKHNEGGIILYAHSEEFGDFVVTPTTDILSKDMKGQLCVFGKLSSLEKNYEITKKIDVHDFLCKIKFGCSYMELLKKFYRRFKNPNHETDKKMKFSHLNEVENKILCPKRTDDGIYYYALSYGTLKQNIRHLSKEDIDFLIDEFDKVNFEANQSLS